MTSSDECIINLIINNGGQEETATEISINTRVQLSQLEEYYLLSARATELPQPWQLLIE